MKSTKDSKPDELLFIQQGRLPKQHPYCDKEYHHNKCSRDDNDILEREYDV